MQENILQNKMTNLKGDGFVMKVRTWIAQNRGIKYEIDGRLYEHEMYIPEIVRDMEVKSYVYTRINETVLKLRTEKTHRLADCITL